MPTLFRTLLIVGALALAGWGVLWLLATVLEPAPGEIIVTIPPERYAPNR